MKEFLPPLSQGFKVGSLRLHIGLKLSQQLPVAGVKQHQGEPSQCFLEREFAVAVAIDRNVVVLF